MNCQQGVHHEIYGRKIHNFLHGFGMQSLMVGIVVLGNSVVTCSFNWLTLSATQQARPYDKGGVTSEDYIDL